MDAFFYSNFSTQIFVVVTCYNCWVGTPRGMDTQQKLVVYRKSFSSISVWSHCKELFLHQLYTDFPIMRTTSVYLSRLNNKARSCIDRNTQGRQSCQTVLASSVNIQCANSFQRDSSVCESKSVVTTTFSFIQQDWYLCNMNIDHGYKLLDPPTSSTQNLFFFFLIKKKNIQIMSESTNLIFQTFNIWILYMTNMYS